MQFWGRNGTLGTNSFSVEGAVSSKCPCFCDEEPQEAPTVRLVVCIKSGKNGRTFLTI